MKKLNVLFAVAVAAMTFAVSANAQISVGAGYTNRTMIQKQTYKLGDGVSGKSWEKASEKLDGFYIEASYNFTFASVAGGELGLQPGLRYNCLVDMDAKGRASIKGEGVNIKAYDKISHSEHSFDIPVNVKYSYDFIPGTLKGYAFAGPVISIGLASKYSEIASYGGKSGDQSIEYKEVERYNRYTGKYVIKEYDDVTEKVVTNKGKDDRYKSDSLFDLKLGIGVGATVAKKYDVKFGYNIGLLNTAFEKNTEDSKYSHHANVLYFGVAYNF